jgi:tetratricopeptide (TPR) repeat protein
MGRYRSKPTPDASSTEAALDAMDAHGLRALILEMIPWFDDVLHARFVNALVDRAARTTPSWAPKAPDSAQVGEIQQFAEAARRIGYAEPSDVDAYLRQGANAFLAKNYAAALQIFRALLIPAGHGEFHLGQDEMIDEVLGIDPATCAAQYVASMYMTATPKNRGKAVLAAIDEMRGIGHFWEPLRELERVAIEPLPDLDDFLVQWKALVEAKVPKDRRNDWDSDEDRWLREVVQRTRGPEGLAEVARASKRADDLRAWCRALVEASDWKGALAAYDEAADLVADKEYTRGDFLDGAALAAQEIGHKDLPARLERAWREAPSMVRLRRWLGSLRISRIVNTCVGAS